MRERNSEQITTPESSDHDVGMIKSEDRYRPTAEVPFLLLFFVVSLTGTVISNLLLFRTCTVTLGYNETVCESLQSTNKSVLIEQIEKEVQSYLTVVTMTIAVLDGIYPAFFSIFLGVWSEKHGRKPLIVWPLFGVAISSISSVIFAMIPSAGPWWYVLTAIPASLTGGVSTLFTGAFCYITDITSSKNRSIRIAILEAALFVGLVFGSIASPYAFRKLGYVYLLLVGSALRVSALIYASLFIKESIPNPVSGGILSAVKIKSVQDMFKTCFKRRPNYDRVIICLLLTTSAISIFNLHGIVELDYMYTRIKVAWIIDEYTIFNAVNTMIMLFGIYVGTCVMQRCCKVGDMPIIILACLSFMADCCIKAFAVQSWQFYLAGSISFLRGTGSPLIKSTLSKMVPAEDISRVFTLQSSFSAILPIFAPIVYNLIYKMTIESFPGAVYLFASGLYGICFIMVSMSLFLQRRHPTKIYSPLDEEL